MSWINDLKASASWGDDIRATTIGGINCCWTGVHNSKDFHYWVAGQLTQRQQAYSDASKVKELTGAGVTVLFTDKQATDAQVEEAMHEAGMLHGVGCDFLSAELSVKRNALLSKYQEGMTFELFSQETGGEL